MLDGALTSGLIDARATFEVFTRSLPNGYRYGVVAGTGRLLEELAAFRFDEPTIEWLLAQHVVSPALAQYLANYRFDGDIVGYLEGEVFTSLSPVLRLEGRFADIVLETLTLSILNFDSGVATKAMRVVRAAQGRRLIEMGSRRTNERAAVAAARASYIAGFDATSNLAAGMLYDIPTAGTAAHAFVLAHESERAAFEAQLATQGTSTTLLVDTFDTEVGTELALDVAGPDLGAIRIDSGVIADAALRSRKLLDQRGATSVKITLTGDLDEFAITDLLQREIPVDTFGVGTKLVSGYTPPGFVFKLVAIEDGTAMRSVAKRSVGKLSTGGAKMAYRLFDDDGAAAELMIPRERQGEPLHPRNRALTSELVRDGVAIVDTSALAARGRAAAAVSELPVSAFNLAEGEPVLVSHVIAESTSQRMARPGVAPHDPERRGAIIVVDPQPDFFENGPLPIPGATATAERIRDYLAAQGERFAVAIVTQDWHVNPGAHWSSTPNFESTWPVHCVANSPGAQIHEALAHVQWDAVIHKGAHEGAYSGFEGQSLDGTSLAEVLATRGIRDVTVVGFATDHCVKSTALDAQKRGFEVRVALDLCAGVSPETTQTALTDMRDAGISIMQSSEL